MTSFFSTDIMLLCSVASVPLTVKATSQQ